MQLTRGRSILLIHLISGISVAPVSNFSGEIRNQLIDSYSEKKWSFLLALVPWCLAVQSFSHLLSTLAGGVGVNVS